MCVCCALVESPNYCINSFSSSWVLSRILYDRSIPTQTLKRRRKRRGEKKLRTFKFGQKLKWKHENISHIFAFFFFFFFFFLYNLLKYRVFCLLCGITLILFVYSNETHTYQFSIELMQILGFNIFFCVFFSVYMRIKYKRNSSLHVYN